MSGECVKLELSQRRQLIEADGLQAGDRISTEAELTAQLQVRFLSDPLHFHDDANAAAAALLYNQSAGNYKPCGGEQAVSGEKSVTYGKSIEPDGCYATPK